MSRVSVVLLACALGLGTARSEYLNKKLCDDTDGSQCAVLGAFLEPCSDGGAYCSVQRGKRYTLTVDFVPKFSAGRVNVSMWGDWDGSGAYGAPVKAAGDACALLTCPLAAGTRRLFDAGFALDKTFPPGKYPVKVKLYNPENEKQTCCFTFNVKIKK